MFWPPKMKKHFFKQWISISLFMVFLIPSTAFAQVFNFNNFVELLGEDVQGTLSEGLNCAQTGFTNFLATVSPDPLKQGMAKRQLDVADGYNSLSKRVSSMNKDDPKKDNIEDLLDDAAKSANDFLCLDINNEVEEREFGSFAESRTFTEAEQEALSALSDVNKAILSPRRPAEVPQGDLLEDFIPNLVRLLFRFASLAVFVSFVISGLMFVAALGNEERVTKAKQMLYWTLVGFAFVTLAFALVKAITDIDFFGFI